MDAYTTIWKTLVYFFLLSNVGWILETIYRSVGNREFTNAGLLRGPYVPIYGTAATIILLVDRAFTTMPLVWKILLLTLFATLLEYVTSFLLEKLFSFKLWDYSKRWGNIHGRICVRYSLYWVLLVTFDLQFLQQRIYSVITAYESPLLQVATYLFTAIFIIDLLSSFHLMMKVKSLYHLLESKKEELSNKVTLKSPLLWRDFRRLLQSFPKLIEKVSSSTLSAINSTSEEGKEPNFTTLKESGNSDFSLYAADILEDPTYLQLKKYHHHEHSIYDHSYLVALQSYKIGEKIEHVINLDMRSLVRGALLHDFFLYDWRKEKPENGRLHAFEHPKEAYRNATRYFGPLNNIEKDIILKHMWPLNIFLPKYIETCIVTLVDKIVSSKEFIAEIVKEQRKNR